MISGRVHLELRYCPLLQRTLDCSTWAGDFFAHREPLAARRRKAVNMDLESLALLLAVRSYASSHSFLPFADIFLCYCRLRSPKSRRRSCPRGMSSSWYVCFDL